MTLLEDIADAWRIPADLAESSIDKSWDGTPAHMKVDRALSQTEDPTDVDAKPATSPRYVVGSAA